MKTIFLILAILSGQAFAGISIISDLDDTIKITNSGNIFESIGYGAARRKVYLGMPEFLAGSKSDLTVITASPRILKFSVKRLLKKQGIASSKIVLNGNFRRPDKFDFKVHAIEKVLAASEDQFILLGDDVGEDPEIYDEIIKRYPGRILKSYIHVIKNRPVPESVVRYWSTFELALRENLSGRLSGDSVEKIGEIIVNEKDLEGVFPEFAHCPTTADNYEWSFETTFSALARKVSVHLTHYCEHEWDDD